MSYTFVYLLSACLLHTVKLASYSTKRRKYASFKYKIRPPKPEDRTLHLSSHYCWFLSSPGPPRKPLQGPAAQTWHRALQPGNGIFLGSLILDEEEWVQIHKACHVTTRGTLEMNRMTLPFYRWMPEAQRRAVESQEKNQVLLVESSPNTSLGSEPVCADCQLYFLLRNSGK